MKEWRDHQIATLALECGIKVKLVGILFVNQDLLTITREFMWRGSSMFFIYFYAKGERNNITEMSPNPKGMDQGSPCLLYIQLYEILWVLV